MELKDIKAKAQNVFEFNKEAEELIGTTDGSFFLVAAKNLAEDHARKTGTKVFTIKRDGTSTHPEEVPAQLNAETAKKAKETETIIADLTIAELTDWAASQTEVSILNEALEKIDTKGGKVAIENRIKELNTAE